MELRGGVENGQSSLPHVVMFAGTMVSHAVPCLLLARKLCAVGLNISFINSESIISKLKVILHHTMAYICYCKFR